MYIGLHVCRENVFKKTIYEVFQIKMQAFSCSIECIRVLVEIFKKLFKKSLSGGINTGKFYPMLFSRTRPHLSNSYREVMQWIQVSLSLVP